MSTGDLSAVVLILALIAAPLIYLYIDQRRFKRETFIKVSQIIFNHTNSLYIRRRQLTHQDAYGNTVNKKWDNEKKYFWQNNIAPFLSRKENILLVRYDHSSFIETRMEMVLSRNPFSVFTGRNPIDFELYCADLLRQSGWVASTTKISGDQGADVIAMKNGVKVVIQCKLYSRPVGNKAVQEVIGARSFHSAQFGAVASNADYTAAARALASTSGIELLHYDGLRRWVDGLSKPVRF